MTIKKNISRKKLYYISLITILIFQTLVFLILPFFLFYKMQFTNGNTKSFYLNSFNFWSYFMVLWSFSLFGLLVNIININIKNNRHIIHATLNIFSLIPSIIFVFCALFLFYGDQKIAKISQKDITNDKLLLKIGKIGLLVVNLLGIFMIIFMYLLPYLITVITKNSINIIKYDLSSVITTIVIGILILINLFLVFLSFILKRDNFDIIFGFITLFTSFLPIIIGSIFAILIIVSFRKKLLINVTKN